MTVETALVLGSVAVRRDGELWCLTDLWRANGAERKRQPYEWLRGADAQRLIEFLRETSLPGISLSRKKPGNPGGGEGPTTWAHWQLALAYAKWISPAFHARVNEVYRAFKAGQLVPAGRSAAELELVRIALRLSPAPTKSPWSSEIKVELARLYGIAWEPGMPEPKALRSAYGFVWRIILGDTVYKELKRRNPYPKSGSLHAEWLQEQRLSLARERDFVVTEALIKRAFTWEEFIHDMRAHFRREPLQLGLAKVRGSLPRKAS